MKVKIERRIESEFYSKYFVSLIITDTDNDFSDRMHLTPEMFEALGKPPVGSKLKITVEYDE